MMVNGKLTAFFNDFTATKKIAPPASGTLSFVIHEANSTHPRVSVGKREVWAPEIGSYAPLTRSGAITLTEDERKAETITVRLAVRMVPGSYIGGLQLCEVWDR